ncbi:hypothetical protein JG688_00013474, partial [Phytophthora aleatoria]
QRYPQLKSRLSRTAAIVNYVALKTGIVELQRKEPLTAAERVACADFRRADRGTTEATPLTQPTSELALVQQAFKNKHARPQSARCMSVQRFDNVLPVWVAPVTASCRSVVSVVPLGAMSYPCLLNEWSSLREQCRIRRRPRVTRWWCLHVPVSKSHTIFVGSCTARAMTTTHSEGMDMTSRLGALR